MKTDDESTTVCFGMTSVSHKEDDGLVRVGHAPTNRALCNTLAIAVIIADGHSEFTKATRHYNLH